MNVSTSPESMLYITPEIYSLALSRQKDVINPAASELKKRNSARLSLQFPSPEITTYRHSAIQQHDGVATRSIRAQTGEPHQQLDMGIQPEARIAGRPRTRPYGLQLQPAPRGRPRSTNLSQAQTPTQENLQTSRRGVTRKMGINQ